MPTPTDSRKTVSITGSLVALAAGLVVGGLTHGADGSVVVGVSRGVETLGELWVRALQMVVVPLVICNLLVAITGNRSEEGVGRLGIVTLGVFVGLLVVGAVSSLSIAPWLVGMVPLDPVAVAMLQPEIPDSVARAAESEFASGGLSDWILALVPTNLVDAILRRDILQILVVVLLFGLAITRLPGPQRHLLVEFFRAMNDAIFVLVHWILALTAPAVFALALGFARESGPASLAGVLGRYLLIASGLLLCHTIVLYLIGMLCSRAPAGEWVRAMLPAHAVAISTRSSLATLPILVDVAQVRLRMPAATTGFVLPLAAATFKASRTVSSPMKLLFLAHVYDVDLTAGAILMFTVTVLLISFTSIGIPGGGRTFKTLPVYVALGIPVEGVVLLKTVDVVPDIFKTVCNTTGHLTAASIVTRLWPGPVEAPVAIE